MRKGIWTIVAVCLPLLAQNFTELPFGNPEFHRIDSLEGPSHLTFEPFQKIDWEAKAREQIKYFNFDHPSANQLRLLNEFFTLEFTAPLDPAIERARYLALTMKGWVSLRPMGLEGVAVFDLDRTRLNVIGKHFSGQVVAETAERVQDASFVILAPSAPPEAVRPTTDFHIGNSSGTISYSFKDGPAWNPGPGAPAEMDRAILFRLDSREFLVVKWPPNTACDSRYTLFSLDGGLKPVARNDFNCDV